MYGAVVQAALSPDGTQLATLYRDSVKPEHTAFVHLKDGIRTALTQTEALDLAIGVRDDNAIDYESTTYTTASTGRPALLEFLATATAGALAVLPGDDISEDLADGEVTHWFVGAGESTELADPEIRIIEAE